jgi:hypothetical protein
MFGQAVLIGMLLLLVPLIGVAIYSVALQRKAVNGFLPQSTARTQQALAGQEQALARQVQAVARQEESLALQREATEAHKKRSDEALELQRQAIAQAAESLALQREANDLLREINRQLDQEQHS